MNSVILWTEKLYCCYVVWVYVIYMFVKIHRISNKV